MMHQLKNNDNLPEPNESEFSEFLWMAEEDGNNLENQVIQEIEEEIFEEINLHNSCLHPKSNEEEEHEAFLNEMLAEEEQRDTVFFLSDQNTSNENIDEIRKRLREVNRNGRVNTTQLNTEKVDNLNCKFELNPNAVVFNPPTEANLNPEAKIFIPKDD